jgi:glycerol-3-phosphate O-acyltransferase
MELLGEEKIKESFVRVVKAVKILKMNFGRIHIEFGEPINMNNYLKN